MSLFVVTASRLRDGAILWLDGAQRWSESFGDSAAFDDAAIEAALAVGAESIRTQRVVGVYKVEVTQGASGLVPVSTREHIRAAGPSVRPDFAYPSAAGLGA